MLRIKTPRRHRWASHADEDIQFATRCFQDKLAVFNSYKGNTEQQIKTFISIIRILYDQPALIAKSESLRAMTIRKVDEFNHIVQSMDSKHLDEFVEMTYAFGDLLSELPDHPLYKDE
jgi:hypothetical protein